MSHIIRSVLVAVTLSLGTGLAIAADAGIKIGVIDSRQLMEKAPQAEAAAKRLEKEFEPSKQNMQKKQKEFQELRESLQRNKDVMSSAERSKKEKELAKMEQDYRRMEEETRSDFTNRNREEMDDFQKVVIEAVEKLAVEERYDLILPRETTFYMAERMDLTEKVLERLAKMTKSAPAKDAKKSEGKSDKKH